MASKRSPGKGQSPFSRSTTRASMPGTAARLASAAGSRSTATTRAPRAANNRACRRDALAVERRLNDLVEMVETKRPGGRQFVDADRREPRRPVEPGEAPALVVDGEQDVTRQILRPLQRPRPIRGEPRAAHRHQLLAEQP